MKKYSLKTLLEDNQNDASPAPDSSYEFRRSQARAQSVPALSFWSNLVKDIKPPKELDAHWDFGEDFVAGASPDTTVRSTQDIKYVTMAGVNNAKGQLGEVITACYISAALALDLNVIPEDPNQAIQEKCGKALRDIMRKWTGGNAGGAWAGAMDALRHMEIVKDPEDPKSIKQSLKFDDEKGIKLIIETVIDESRINANSFMTSITGNNVTVGDKPLSQVFNENLEKFGMTRQQAAEIIPDTLVSKWVAGGTAGANDNEVFTAENGGILWPAIGGGERNQADLVIVGLSVSVKVGASQPGKINGGLFRKIEEMRNEISDEAIQSILGYAGRDEEWAEAKKAGEIFGKNGKLKKAWIAKPGQDPTGKITETQQKTIQSEINAIVPEIYEIWAAGMIDLYVDHWEEYLSVNLAGEPCSASDVPTNVPAKIESGETTEVILGTGGDVEEAILEMNLTLAADGKLHIDPKKAEQDYWIWQDGRLISYPRELKKLKEQTEGKKPKTKMTNIMGKLGAEWFAHNSGNEGLMSKMLKHIANKAALGDTPEQAQIDEEVFIAYPKAEDGPMKKTSDLWQNFILFWRAFEAGERDKLATKPAGNSTKFYIKSPNNEGWLYAWKGTMRRSTGSGPISTLKFDIDGSDSKVPEIDTAIKVIQFSEKRLPMQSFFPEDMSTDITLKSFEDMWDSLSQEDLRTLIRPVLSKLAQSTIAGNPTNSVSQRAQRNQTDRQQITNLIDHILASADEIFHDASLANRIKGVIRKYKNSPASVTEAEAQMLINSLMTSEILDDNSLASAVDALEQDLVSLISPELASSESLDSWIESDYSDHKAMLQRSIQAELESLGDGANEWTALKNIFTEKGINTSAADSLMVALQGDESISLELKKAYNQWVQDTGRQDSAQPFRLDESLWRRINSFLLLEKYSLVSRLLRG